MCVGAYVSVTCVNHMHKLRSLIIPYSSNSVSIYIYDYTLHLHNMIKTVALASYPIINITIVADRTTDYNYRFHSALQIILMYTFSCTAPLNGYFQIYGAL